jgi:transposase
MWEIIIIIEGLTKKRKPKYQRQLDGYELRDQNFPLFKIPPLYVREREEITLLGMGYGIRRNNILMATD